MTPGKNTSLFRRWLLIAWAFLEIGLALADNPGGYAGAADENPPSASVSALAGAGYSFAPEPCAVALNPANMYNLTALAAEASYENYALGVSRYSAFFVSPIRGNFRVGGGMIDHAVGDIVGRDDYGAPTQNFSYRYQTYILGAGYGFSRGKITKPCETSVQDFSAGISLKFSGQYCGDTLEGSGAAVDLGVSGKYLNFRYGAVVRNLYGRIWWNDADSTSDRFPPALVLAAGWEYCASSWFEVAVEHKVSGRLRIRAGGQYLVVPWAGFRAGIDFQKGTPTPIDEWRISLGGVIYKKFILPTEISYSVQYIRSVRKFVFGLSLGWNTF